MKKSLIAIFAVLMVALAIPAPAQVTLSANYANVTSRPLVTIHAAIDSVTADTSSSFGLFGYDAESFTTYPLSYGRLIASTGTPRVSVYVDGSFGFDSWACVDTIMTADSVKTFGTGTIDLNDKHFPKYRIRVVGAAGNRSDAVLDLGLYVYKKSY